MYPDLFKIGSFTVHSYGVMLAIAFLVCYFMLQRDFKLYGEDPELAANMIFWAMIGGIVGAKLLFLLENFSDVLLDPKGMIFSGAGLSWFGGLIGGVSAVSWQIIRAKRPYLKIADLTAPYIALGQGIGRIGCFLTGCCYGVPTDLPWGVAFPKGAPPTHTHVHPTQLYEMIINFSIFLFLFFMRKKNMTNGKILALYFVLAGSERFLLEFIRSNYVWWWGLTMAQTIALIALITGLVLLRRLSKKTA